MGLDSDSARLDEEWTGGVLVALDGLGRNSGRDEMSWTVCGCSAWSKGLSWSTTGEDGLEWPRRWKRRWPNMLSARSAFRLVAGTDVDRASQEQSTYPRVVSYVRMWMPAPRIQSSRLSTAKAAVAGSPAQGQTAAQASRELSGSDCCDGGSCRILRDVTISFSLSFSSVAVVPVVLCCVTSVSTVVRTAQA